jgi:hypothetical protein
MFMGTLKNNTRACTSNFRRSMSEKLLPACGTRVCRDDLWKYSFRGHLRI